MIDQLTDQSKATGDSEKHGIKKGDLWFSHWCCNDPNSIWGDDDPPCNVCPNKDFELTFLNKISFERWQQLDNTGRKDQAHFLEESAIDANLTRYKCNHPDIYERVLNIEKGVFESRQSEIERERKRRERKKR